MVAGGGGLAPCLYVKKCPGFILGKVAIASFLKTEYLIAMYGNFRFELARIFLNHRSYVNPCTFSNIKTNASTTVLKIPPANFLYLLILIFSFHL
jgi:hypothetical protein